jgi:hypothetical protein
MRNAIVWLLVAAVCLNSSCCSIFLSGKQTVEISSEPAGASVKVGQYKGTTPYQVTLPRGKDYVIDIKLDEQEQVLALERSIEPLYWVNILFFPGLLVDLATGKLYKYDPSEYEVSFN